jgi:hypothetical protein
MSRVQVSLLITAIVLLFVSLKACAGILQTTNQNYSSSSSSSRSSATSYASQGQGQSQRYEDNSVVIHEAQKRDPVRSAIAPNITISSLSCKSGVSGAAQGTGFGLSFGSTSDDEDCETRMDAVLLFKLGLKDEAILRLCDNPKMANALNAGGKVKCPEPEVVSVNIEYDQNSN